MKNGFLLKGLLFLVFLAPSFAVALDTYTSSMASSIGSEITIDKDGKMSAKRIRVVQIAGSTIFTRPVWGVSFIRLTVKTNNNTEITRKFGEKISVSDIKEGDFLDVEGDLEFGSGNLSLFAQKVKNISDEKENNVLSGTVTSINPTLEDFTMFGKSGSTKVLIGTSTVIFKGGRVVTSRHIKMGDVVTETSGVFDHSTKTLKASHIRVYIDMSLYKLKNFEGVIKSISGSSLPTTFNIVVGADEYKVELKNGVSVLNNKRQPVSLQRFVVGDKVRFYGRRFESDELIIGDVEIIRNLSL